VALSLARKIWVIQGPGHVSFGWSGIDRDHWSQWILIQINQRDTSQDHSDHCSWTLTCRTGGLAEPTRASVRSFSSSCVPLAPLIRPFCSLATDESVTRVDFIFEWRHHKNANYFVMLKCERYPLFYLGYWGMDLCNEKKILLRLKSCSNKKLKSAVCCVNSVVVTEP